MLSLVKKESAKIYLPVYQNKNKKEIAEERKKDYVWRWLMNNDVSDLQEVEEDGLVLCNGGGWRCEE